jgi:hypothetical protein
MGQLMLACLSRTLVRYVQDVPLKVPVGNNGGFLFGLIERSGVRVSSERIVREVSEDRRIASVTQ